MTGATRWGPDFDPDRLARLETRMWKAYYRRQPARLFVPAGPAHCARRRSVSWPRALAAQPAPDPGGGRLRSADRRLRAVRPGHRPRATGILGLPDHVDAEAVARHELRWWVVRREIGLAAGAAAGESITDLYAGLYGVPRERVAEAGRLRGLAAEVRDRGATDDPDGRGVPAAPTGRRSPGCCGTRIAA